MSNRVSTLPDAKGSADEIKKCLGQEGALFLDFDGTLSPIVNHPDDAHIEDSTRELLASLALKFSVGIVSGRGAADIRRRVGVDSLVYAGSHGQEIDMPDGSRFEHPGSLQAVARLDAAEQTLSAALGSIEGLMVERKPFSIAVHYRNARTDEAIAQAKSSASESALDNGLALRGGKKIFEIRPKVDWDKGKAIEYLVDRMPSLSIPMYIGDDETDEDGFAAVNQLRGVSIVVAKPDERRDTIADYRLKDPDEVIAFLEHL